MHHTAQHPTAPLACCLRKLRCITQQTLPKVRMTLFKPVHGAQPHSNTNLAMQDPSGPPVAQLLLQLCILLLQVSDALLQLHHLLWQLLQPRVLLLQVSDDLLQLHDLRLQLLFVPLVLLQALCCQHWALVKPVAQLLPHWLLTLQTQNGSTATAASTASKASYTV